MAKKILIATGIFPPDVGGPATYTALLLKELPKRGFEVQIVSYGEPQINDQPNVVKIFRSWPKGLRHFLYFWKIISLSKKVDLIFAQDPISAGLPVFLASKILKKNFILKVVGDYAWEQGVQRFGVQDSIENFQDTNKEYQWLVRILRWIQSGVARGADLVIVPSNYLGQNVVQKWRVDQNKIKVIYNGISTPENLPDKETARRQLNISGNILVSIGRLVPWKGFEMLIEAVSELKNEIQDLKLFIIGEGPEYNKLKIKSRRLEVNDNIIFTGALPRQKVFKYIRAADVFALNTAYEGFSHLLIEVLALGTPAMATGIGGNLEILNSNNAEIFNFNDKAVFKNKLLNLFHSPERRNVIVANGLKRAKEFSEESMLKNLTNLLEKL